MWFEFYCKRFFVHVQTRAKIHGFGSNRFGVTTTQENSTRLTLKMNLKDICYLIEVRLPNFRCRRTRAHQKMTFLSSAAFYELQKSEILTVRP